MIYTVTLNPSVDLTLAVGALKSGDVARASAAQRDAGGKGLNISRAICLWGGSSVAFTLCGRDGAAALERLLRRAKVAVETVSFEGTVRSNVSLVIGRGTKHYKVNEPGPRVPHAAAERMVRLLRGRLGRRDSLVISGSAPPGLNGDYVGRLVRLGAARGARVFLDGDGEILRCGAAAAPFLIKPNQHELTRLLGWRRFSLRRLVVDSIRLMRRVEHLVVSLGAAGVFYRGGEQALFVRPPQVHLRSEVGCGDALVAATVWSLERGLPMTEALRWGVAAGAAKVTRTGTTMPTLGEVEEVLRKVEIETAG